MFNLEAELAADLAEAFGIAEGSAFVTGDGTGKPKGLLASVTAEVKTGAAANFAAINPADVLFKAFHAIAGGACAVRVWMMNRNVLGTIRQWKDGQGRYLLADPITAGAPMTLLGRPVVKPSTCRTSQPMHRRSSSAISAPIASSTASLWPCSRDPFSIATTGQVRFHARKRVGGDLTHTDRLVRIKVAA